MKVNVFTSTNPTPHQNSSAVNGYEPAFFPCSIYDIWSIALVGPAVFKRPVEGSSSRLSGLKGSSTIPVYSNYLSVIL